MISSLNCPTCGAPASDPKAVKCEYCGSHLTAASCPKCFGAMFAGMDFCPHCGAKADRSIDPNAPALKCPGCKSDMHALHVGATPMHECSSCASLWLEASVFAALCVNREERGRVVAFADVTKVEPTASIPRGAVRYLPCPVCKKVMNRQNFGRRSGVVIDVCKNDGVWFEQHELQAVLAFIDSGAFEKARLDEEKRVAEEREKLQKTFESTSRAWIQINRTVTHTRTVFGKSPDAVSGGIEDALKMLFS